MDSAISTISSSVSENRSRISNEVRVSYGTSDVSGAADQPESSAQRKPRWQHTAGIQVSLQSLDQEPQLDEYRQLRSDGRRKESTKVAPEVAETGNVHRTIEAEQLEEGSANSRSVNPRTKTILDNFIQQMGGTEQSLSSGNYINTSV